VAKEKILIIEDEKNIVELLKYNLEEVGYRVQVAARGDSGLELARKEKPDLLILDLMLPGLDGIEICRILKQNEKTFALPIVMLTAKGTEADKVVGLELGADDYITKPFSPREFLARVKAVLRRGHVQAAEKVLKAGVLEVNVAKHVVMLKGKVISLTSKEYDLLVALMEARGRVLSRSDLLDRVWGYDQSASIETRTVDMHLGQLRKKLKSEERRFITVKNVGYRFDFDA
jgi:two-component system alkaline phosphatase synthesis response regulator PhoP